MQSKGLTYCIQRDSRNFKDNSPSEVKVLMFKNMVLVLATKFSCFLLDQLDMATNSSSEGKHHRRISAGRVPYF